MRKVSRSRLLSGSYLVVLLAVEFYLAQLLPFSSFNVPVSTIFLSTILLVFAGRSLIIIGMIAVTLTEHLSSTLVLILFVSLTATLASASQTVASGSLGFCNPGVTSKGFPFPWIFQRRGFILGFGVPSPRCNSPATGLPLPVLAPLFFSFDVVFYFAASLVISQLYTALVKPLTSRWNRPEIR